MRYENLDGVTANKSFRELRAWMKERKSKVKDLSATIPTVDRKRTDEIACNRDRISYTWIGHATFLIQMGGLNVLTDPVFAPKMGFSRRMTPPGLTLDELPDIDLVVISHGHYDHLEFPTLRKLKGRPAFCVPAGMETLFRKKGLTNVTEANWWDTLRHREVDIHFVPAQHWTRRTLFDTNTSHWGGWVLQAGGRTLYFVGDTGYFRGFREIGARFAVDVVFMPIGAYEPEWFMKESHINPEDAVKAFLELDAETFVPMHYGAYRLADDTGPEALDRLLREWARLGLPERRLRVLKIGETVFPQW